MDIEELVEYDSDSEPSEPREFNEIVSVKNEDFSPLAPNENLVDCVGDVRMLINYAKKINHSNPKKHKLETLLEDEVRQQKEMKVSVIKIGEGNILSPLPNEVAKLIFSYLGSMNFKSVFR